MENNWLINYPVWELDYFGGGFLIALIAVFHVYVAHFAVGGGLFLVLTEIKGHRENSQAILDYTKRHSKFFLLLTMVFGGVTGVGIWFTISLLSPSATSTLIHAFVFGWATEWVFFVGEIVALFVYYYSFGKMEKKDHLTVGWLYFAFAWLSLFVVNGIVAFMLTPGKDWLITQDFWDGFFNPSFFPSLFFRTFIAFMFAGLFGFITSVYTREKDFRETMLRYCAWWLIIPLIFVLVSGWWYVSALPEPQKSMILTRSPEIPPFLKTFLWISPVIFVAGIVMTLRIPGPVKKVTAYGLVLIGLVYMGSFEWIREAGRRPYLICGHTYSNSVLAKDQEKVKKAGILKSARWAKIRNITDSNQVQAGREIFRFLCISCHSVGGPVNDILPLVKKSTVFGMESMLTGMGKLNNYMPEFMGNPKEKKALAIYIADRLCKKQEKVSQFSASPLPVQIPDFDPEKDEYVLLAWSDTGMNLISDSGPYWMIRPPGNKIRAHLIRRGETPEIVTDDVELAYEAEPGFENPSDHVRLWDYAKPLFGRDIAPGTGLSGNSLKGKMKLDEERGAFATDLIPIVPYPEHGTFNPYPLLTIEARDIKSGKVLARTKTVAPVSTEMGCRNCHGGDWRVAGVAGLSSETAKDILAVHDKNSKTNLLKMAEKGQPMQCRSCHASPGSAELLNLSAAMHGFHASYLTGKDAEACMSCHPSSSESFTKSLRGIHNDLEMNCTNCHGKLEDHALSLLKAEKAEGKKRADILMKHIKPGSVSTADQIKPRKPWISEPDCMNCHADFNPPETDESEFGMWTKNKNALYHLRSDDAGIMCSACHGSAHAVYPATNIFGSNRDNISPVQYQGNPYPIGANKNCRVCHMQDMDEEVHHPNSLTMFRNSR